MTKRELLSVERLDALNGKTFLTIRNTWCKGMRISLDEDDIAELAVKLPELFPENFAATNLGTTCLVIPESVSTKLSAKMIRETELGAIGLLPPYDELEELRSKVASLFAAIAHGDDEHRAWLRDAIDKHFAGEIEREEG